MAGAVQRFAMLSYEREETEDTITLHVTGLEDSAYMMMRVNTEDEPSVTGGTLTKLTDMLYLLEIQEDEVVITK